MNDLPARRILGEMDFNIRVYVIVPYAQDATRDVLHLTCTGIHGGELVFSGKKTYNFIVKL